MLKMGRVCIIYLREVAIVESGHNEWKTKSAVEEVGQGEMKNQDCFAGLQLRDFIWVPDALFSACILTLSEILYISNLIYVT